MRNKFLLATLFFLSVPASLIAATETKYQRQQLLADQLYNEGEYTEAFDQYMPLAKKGDSFSQYRVSYMYLEGQGTETDLVESYAWAYLAAQNRQEELEEYRDVVGSLVPEKKHRKALRKVDYYMRKWGNLAVARDAAKGARNQLRNCTGSRVGTRCEDVEAMQMPTFWGITPGAGTYTLNAGVTGDGGGAAPSGSVSSPRGHAGSGAPRDVDYYKQLRASIRDMNRYIEENSGTVNLGEFHVIEDEPASKEDSNGR